MVKPGLTRVGSRLSDRAIHNLNSAFNYLELGAWMRRHGFVPVHRLPDRFALFDYIGNAVRDERVLYLEFGVYEGAVTRYWVNLLKHPDSRLHGFDSFEGLPADWTLDRPAGHFGTKGQVPTIADRRVEFFKGWFTDTLPEYVPPEHDRLVVIFDADLYASTAFALDAVRDYVRPGSLLYFDDFNHRADEMRAFEEFLSTSSLRFRLVAATKDLGKVAFQCVTNDAGGP